MISLCYIMCTCWGRCLGSKTHLTQCVRLKQQTNAWHCEESRGRATPSTRDVLLTEEQQSWIHWLLWQQCSCCVQMCVCWFMHHIYLTTFEAAVFNKASRVQSVQTADVNMSHTTSTLNSFWRRGFHEGKECIS